MRRSLLSAFIADCSAAVAPSYALALTGLIVVMGVGYDYAQLATLDTEMQGAADQAALAAATQLDGNTGAIADATSAASNLVVNRSLMARDGGANTLAVQSVTFYATKANAEAETSPVTADATAKFVVVKLVSRQASYTLTPILSRVTRSQSVAAAAVAGLGSAICREPPLFVCKPAGSIADPVAWINSRRGYGILLKAKGSSWSPGNFGFLATNAGSGANDISKLLAYSNPPGDCVSVDAPETAPGQKQSVVADFNTRFDIYDGGDNIDCWGSNSKCPPAANSRKDIVQASTAAPAKKDCDSPDKGWIFSNRPYRPTSPAVITGTVAADFPDAMGLPRDLCHAVPEASHSCSEGFVGNGAWDINAYWWATYGAAYPGTIATAISGRTYPTRYEVYRWEQVGTNSPAYRDIPGTSMRNHKAPICRAAPTAGTPDRRVIPVAVVDCSTLGNGGGTTTVYPLDWMDVFLVEPSLDRKTSPGNTVFTSKGDFYGEIIGRTGQGTGNAGAQVVRRDKPYLVK